MITLLTPVSQLTRVGEVTASRLKKLGIQTAADLLFWYPFRYDDFSQILAVNQLQPEKLATIKAKVEIIQNKRSPIKRKIVTEAIVSDNSGQIKITWFNQPFIAQTLRPGDEVYFAGKVDYDGWGIQFTNPSYEKIEPWRKDAVHTGRLVPIYSTTENLTPKQIRFLAKTVLPLAMKMPDFLPPEIKNELGLLSLGEALTQIHFPTSLAGLRQAEKRLKFDELFLIQLQSQRTKNKLQQLKAPLIDFQAERTRNFVNSLPFKLTDAQRKAAWEIIKDLGRPRPMNRLLEGEVGSGKTIVAAIAGLNAIWNGYQVIFMAPTEILAKQHYENIKKLFKNFKVGAENRADEKLKIKKSPYPPTGDHPKGGGGPSAGGLETKSQGEHQAGFLKHKKIEVGILTRTEKNIETNKDGIVVSDFIIGTHALIQDDIKFKKLGLVIIDEQHRFGVEQRKTLKEKSQADISPHFLSMTATPIPRSLALTLYGDLDLSVIDQMPANRKKIITKIVNPTNRQKAYDFIHDQIKQGRQVFVVCPLIEESEKLEAKSAETEYEKIDKQVFPHLRVGLIHGKLKTKEKEQTRRDFWQGKLDILVATAVVEVGIDVPNATVMMIEGADRFGLAQLHQFRGRVGRSEYQSYCFLFTESNSLKTQERLEALLTAKNGFELAEKDLEIRGPGEIYGTSQSGFFSGLKIAKLTDYEIIKLAREQAEKLIKKDPGLLRYPDLKQKIENIEAAIHFE